MSAPSPRTRSARRTARSCCSTTPTAAVVHTWRRRSTRRRSSWTRRRHTEPARDPILRNPADILQSRRPLRRLLDSGQLLERKAAPYTGWSGRVCHLYNTCLHSDGVCWVDLRASWSTGVDKSSEPAGYVP
ncbi:hypothetical protein TCAP_06771 [Tolypocladium capitatum]|uniref:Uncharacterized protein n=1 Tax=Tolypocladium capitatum TaxID=45235 RepID=A0A2K3Q722_9HYPO|nr:hypothetical protein TCAP_06771 [Tolypocladium capitatum]